MKATSDLLPDGEYEVVIKGVKFGRGLMGAPYITWVLETAKGQATPKRRLFLHTPASAPWRLKELMKALGVRKKVVDDDKIFEQIGKHFLAIVKARYDEIIQVWSMQILKVRKIPRRKV